MRDRRVALILAAGLLVGWIAGPRIASAVGSLVTIQNTAGTKAGVTKAHQLQVAEAGPGTFREFAISTADQNCHDVVAVPSNRSFVVKSLSFVVDSASSSGLQVALVYPNGTCTGREMYSASTGVLGSHDVSIEPGFVVGHSGFLTIKQGGDGVIAVYVWGYLVPKAAAPSTTPVG